MSFRAGTHVSVNANFSPNSKFFKVVFLPIIWGVVFCTSSVCASSITQSFTQITGPVPPWKKRLHKIIHFPDVQCVSMLLEFTFLVMSSCLARYEFVSLHLVFTHHPGFQSPPGLHPLKLGLPTRNSSSNHPFSGAILVSGRVHFRIKKPKQYKCLFATIASTSCGGR